MRHVWTAVLVLGLIGCGGDDDGGDETPPPPSNKGTISGTLRPFVSGQSRPGDRASALSAQHARARDALRAALRARTAAASGYGVRAQANQVPDEAPVVPGEVVVRLAEVQASGRVTPAALARAPDGFELAGEAPITARHRVLRYRGKGGRALGAAETRALVARVAAQPGVVWAEPNLVLHKLKVPDDPGYSAQWHYPKMNLPAAWDVEDGSGAGATPVTVAVVDTGIVAHPDLDDVVVGGYDFISDATRAGDGDGRDSNPRDQGGDEPGGGSSWHGTHVAGTVGASTDSGTGVSGVAWRVRIVPVRVLGREGGTSKDIAEGMLWAAGGSVAGVPANPHPAKVVNLSLGGKAPPSKLYQDVIDERTAAGAIFVIAAGNADADAGEYTPCNQERVICVGSSRFNGRRSSFSNFGPEVDVMAPGGEMSEDLNGDGYPDGVLSTTLDDDGQTAYSFANGTSMAAPHVAGLVALMHAARRAAGLSDLTAAQAETLLKQTAETAFQCAEGCGAGGVNALAAVTAARGTTPTGPARLSVPTTELLLRGTGTAQGTLSLSNVGGAPLSFTTVLTGAEAGRVSVSPASGEVASGSTRVLTLDANLSGLTAGQSVTAVLGVDAGDAGRTSVALTLRVPPAGAGGAAAVGFAYLDALGEFQVDETEGVVETGPQQGYAYRATLTPREYYVIGLLDDDADGNLEDGESVGFWRNMDAIEPVVLEAGQTVGDISFDLVPDEGLDTSPEQNVGAACTSDAACTGGGECLGGDVFPGGYCSVDCTTAECPAGSTCVVLTDTANNEFDYCLQTCTSPGGQSSCRSGYTCTELSSGTGVCFGG